MANQKNIIKILNITDFSAVLRIVFNVWGIA